MRINSLAVLETARDKSVKNEIAWTFENKVPAVSKKHASEGRVAKENGGAGGSKRLLSERLWKSLEK